MKMPQEKNGEITDLKRESVTLYCAEIRTMRKEDITRLEAFEMKVWRRMEKISWTERISNEVLRGAVHKVRHARGAGGPRRCYSL